MKDMIGAFSFGVPSTLWANYAIATIAARTSFDFNGAPVFTQQDIQFKRLEAVYCTEQPNEPPPTLRIAREMVQYAIRNSVRRIWVVAARPHLPRCMRDVKYAVREEGARIEVHVCEEVYDHGINSWFSKDSTQPRVRSAMDWWPRELFLWLMPMFIYKKVAS